MAAGHVSQRGCSSECQAELCCLPSVFAVTFIRWRRRSPGNKKGTTATAPPKSWSPPLSRSRLPRCGELLSHTVKKPCNCLGGGVGGEAKGVRGQGKETHGWPWSPTWFWYLHMMASHNGWIRETSISELPSFPPVAKVGLTLGAMRSKIEVSAYFGEGCRKTCQAPNGIRACSSAFMEGTSTYLSK